MMNKYQTCIAQLTSVNVTSSRAWSRAAAATEPVLLQWRHRTTVTISWVAVSSFSWSCVVVTRSGRYNKAAQRQRHNVSTLLLWRIPQCIQKQSSARDTNEAFHTRQVLFLVQHGGVFLDNTAAGEATSAVTDTRNLQAISMPHCEHYRVNFLCDF